MKNILYRLYKIYKNDKLTQKYNVLETFKTYKSRPNSTTRHFLTKLEKRSLETLSHGTKLSDGLLVYRQLKWVNLPIRNKQLAKTTITEQKYDSIKSNLLTIFSDNYKIQTPDFNWHANNVKTVILLFNHMSIVTHLTKLTSNKNTMSTKLITFSKIMMSDITNTTIPSKHVTT